MAAFAEATAELEKKDAKRAKKRKKKKTADQVADLEKMLAQLEQDGGDMDMETAAATLKLLEDPQPKKKEQLTTLSNISLKYASNEHVD